MSFRIRPFLVLAIALASAFVGLRPAAAATAPPPVSTITVTERTAYGLGIAFVVPAAYYAPNSGGVVRITRGYTPASTPSAGYAVPVVGRTAHTPESSSLTANVVYTLAVWVRSNGLYSARRTIALITRPDTVGDLRSSVSVGGPTYGPFGVRVSLSWENPAGPLKAIRIVRNTAPTTTGGTVVTLPGSARSYVDTALPSIVCDLSAPTGCSTEPVRYWVLPESSTSGFADRYLRTDAVVGSRTISGTVSGNFRGIIAFCCPNPIDGSATGVTGASADPAVNGGAFTVHVPPGVFSVCTGGATNGNTGKCWVVNNGVGSAQPWDGTLDSGQLDPTIDMTTQTTYPDVRL